MWLRYVPTHVYTYIPFIHSWRGTNNTSSFSLCSPKWTSFINNVVNISFIQYKSFIHYIDNRHNMVFEKEKPINRAGINENRKKEK